jgi:hypothetical protein
MAVFTRARRLGRLAFFLALAASAAVIDACGSTKTSPRAPTGGAGGGSNAGTGGSAGHDAGVTITGGNSSGGADAGAKDASDLWDVICE